MARLRYVCAVVLFLGLGISLTKAYDPVGDGTREIDGAKPLERQKRATSKLDIFKRVVIGGAISADAFDKSHGSKIDILGGLIQTDTGLYGAMTPVLSCMNLICGPIQTLHDIPDAIILVKNVLANVKALLELFNKNVLGFLSNLAKPLKFIVIPVRLILEKALIPALEITVNVIKAFERTLKAWQLKIKPFYEICGITKAHLLAASGVIKIANAVSDTNVEQDMLSAMEGANQTCWNIVDKFPVINTEWNAALTVTLAVTNIALKRRAKRELRRDRRQTDPAFEELVKRQRAFYAMDINDIFKNDEFLGKKSIAMRNGLEELLAVVKDIEPINSVLENIKDTLNDILDKELCIDVIGFADKLVDALGVAVDFAEDIVDAARRITIDDIENAAVLVKRHFQAVGEFLEEELDAIGKTVDDIGDTLSDVGDTIVDTGETVVKETVQFAKDASGAIVDTGEKAVDATVDAGKTVVGGVEKGAEETVDFFKGIPDIFGRRKREVRRPENIAKIRNTRQASLSVDDAARLSRYFKNGKICVTARLVLQDLADLFDTILKPFELFMDEILKPLMDELKEYFEDLVPDADFLNVITDLTDRIDPDVNFPSFVDLESIKDALFGNEIINDAITVADSLNSECEDKLADFVGFPTRVTTRDLDNACSAGKPIVRDPRTLPIFDCVKTPYGLSYAKKRAVSKSGVACLPWTIIADILSLTDADFPHDGSIMAAENFCRNPTSEDSGPWCPISETEIETCGLPICEPGVSPSKECLLSPNGADYQGTADSTESGTECRRWDEVEEELFGHASLTLPDDFDKTSAENYCRNPGGEKDKPFCFVADESIFESCDISPCLTGCKEDAKGTEYTGTASTTVNGLTCQRWGEHYPHMHHVPATSVPERSLNLANNFCRNPDRDPGGPWCFTTDPDTVWEYCAIPFCDSAIAFNGTARLPGIQYSPDYDNINSPASRQVSDTFCANMDKVNIDQFGDKYKGCAVKDLDQGSLIIDYELYFKTLVGDDLDKIAKKIKNQSQKLLNNIGDFTFSGDSVLLELQIFVHNTGYNTRLSYQL